MIFRCAGCHIEIDYEKGESLCPECIKKLCDIKVSWDDCPEKDNNEKDNNEKETDEKYKNSIYGDFGIS